MKDKLNEQQNEEILQALDDAIHKGPWEQSNFLRVIGKHLKEIRENFRAKMGSSRETKIKKESFLANRMSLRSGQQEIFISLYSSDGTNIQSWEKILANLPRQVISRPIYRQESQAKDLIKSKENKLNEAYVAIYINQADIIDLPPDKALIDKLGNNLLTLKDKTLDLENISRFVHANVVYQWERGRLVKES